MAFDLTSYIETTTGLICVYLFYFDNQYIQRRTKSGISDWQPYLSLYQLTHHFTYS